MTTTTDEILKLRAMVTDDMGKDEIITLMHLLNIPSSADVNDVAVQTMSSRMLAEYKHRIIVPLVGRGNVFVSILTHSCHTVRLYKYNIDYGFSYKLLDSCKRCIGMLNIPIEFVYNENIWCTIINGISSVNDDEQTRLLLAGILYHYQPRNT